MNKSLFEIEIEAKLTSDWCTEDNICGEFKDRFLIRFQIKFFYF